MSGRQNKRGQTGLTIGYRLIYLSEFGSGRCRRLSYIVEMVLLGKPTDAPREGMPPTGNLARRR